MKITITRILAVSLFAFAPFLFVGCDTGEGLGEDIQDVGDEIEDAAQDAQDEM